MQAPIRSDIDLHHHSFPPAYVEYLNESSRASAGWKVDPWTLQTARDYCEHAGIGVAILSIIPGGPPSSIDLERAREFTRQCNEFNAGIVRDSPDSFGFFAHVTNMCEVDLTIEEIKHALNVLSADGVTLATSYQKDDKTFYLGDSLFTPIWDVLNARGAVVFIHPTSPPNMAVVNPRLPPPSYDFPHETGRTAIDMITNPSNMLQDHAANCKIILSHAGGDLPYLIDRVAGLMCMGPKPLRLGITPEEVLDRARAFYYDTALSCSPMQLGALASLLGPDHLDHVLFGTDFPPAGEEAIQYFTEQLNVSEIIRKDDLRRNALKLFPRFHNKQQDKNG